MERVHFHYNCIIIIVYANSLNMIKENESSIIMLSASILFINRLLHFLYLFHLDRHSGKTQNMTSFSVSFLFFCKGLACSSISKDQSTPGRNSALQHSIKGEPKCHIMFSYNVHKDNQNSKITTGTI